MKKVLFIFLLFPLYSVHTDSQELRRQFYIPFLDMEVLLNEYLETIYNKPDFSNYLTALSNSQLPDNIKRNIEDHLYQNSAFINDLEAILDKNSATYDPYLFILVDKNHSLSENYAPFDIEVLRNGFYYINEAGLMLRREAARSLEEMAAAARAEGLSLLVSSAYRSYIFQDEVFSTWARQLGQQSAERISARPGHSQHQLGTTIDFGSITDDFAYTREGRWLAANASRFGWSLSYPRGFEHITGYNWESWHYRYVGKQLAAFIDNYFEGIQQYALRFIHEFLLAA